ncbi:hypothetical protein DBR23_21295, partial [Acidovorax sp. HMWF018]|uniref:hypothetical protein n=1 Tax=Acidovorax sp. HMWF018 TaxID=2056855 RepID=UPI000D4D3297
MDKNTFSKMIPSNSFSNIHQEYLAAMKWMTDLGIDLQVGRTSNFEKWAAAGFDDTLLRWKMKPEVVHGEKKDIQPRV